MQYLHLIPNNLKKKVEFPNINNTLHVYIFSWHIHHTVYD